MEILEQRHGAVTVLRPQGPIASGDAAQFKRQAQEVMTRSLGRLVLDASSVAYVDSAGLEALVEVSEEMMQSGRALRVCGMNETVREVLDITDLLGRIEHFEDLTAAVRSFL